jgi:hypothetical protein
MSQAPLIYLWTCDWYQGLVHIAACHVSTGDGEQEICDIQDVNKFSNTFVCIYNYIEMREGMGKPAATVHVWIVW